MPPTRTPPLVEEGALRRLAVPIAKALNTISADTGQSFTMRNQPGRFRIQKTVYLLRCLGYPSARRFDFNIYHMGPYSPALAQAYYLLEDDGLRAAGLTSDVPAETLRLVAEATARSHDFLEGLTTLIDVMAQSGSPATALAQAKAIKRHLNESTWKEVREFLQSHPALIRAI